MVEHSDVSIHVVDVVGVGGVLGNVPLLWFGTLGGEHVTTVLGFIIHTVETSHLPKKRIKCHFNLVVTECQHLMNLNKSFDHLKG